MEKSGIFLPIDLGFQGERCLDWVKGVWCGCGVVVKYNLPLPSYLLVATTGLVNANANANANGNANGNGNANANDT